MKESKERRCFSLISNEVNPKGIENLVSSNLDLFLSHPEKFCDDL